TEQGASRANAVAGQMWNAARALGEAIAQFKVRAGDAQELVRELESRGAEMQQALSGLLDLTGIGVDAAPEARAALERMLAGLEGALSAARGRLGKEALGDKSAAPTTLSDRRAARS